MRSQRVAGGVMVGTAIVNVPVMAFPSECHSAADVGPPRAVHAARLESQMLYSSPLPHAVTPEPCWEPGAWLRTLKLVVDLTIEVGTLTKVSTASVTAMVPIVEPRA